jgi:hypothetical protein
MGSIAGWAQNLSFRHICIWISSPLSTEGISPWVKQSEGEADHVPYTFMVWHSGTEDILPLLLPAGTLPKVRQSCPRA